MMKTMSMSLLDARDQPVIAGDVNPTPVLLGVGLALGFLVGAGITAIVVVSKCRPKTRKRGRMAGLLLVPLSV